MTNQQLPQLLTIRDVQRITTLSRASIYRFMAAGRFPKPISISTHRRAWNLIEIEAWNESPLDWGRDPWDDGFPMTSEKSLSEAPASPIATDKRGRPLNG
jgi:prophage regulatory protein